MKTWYLKSFLGLLVLNVLILSCSKIDTLNLRPHVFSETPQSIVWFQVAGFHEEHMALLRFNKMDSVRPSAFEEVMCVGKMWNYDLFNLRPSAANGFVAQMMGSKNIKGDCSDFARRPLWSYLSEIGHKTAILENTQKPEESLAKLWTCGALAGDDFHLNATLWSMSPSKNTSDKTFHYQINSDLNYGVYFDKSCSQNSNCTSDLFSNAKSLFERLRTGQSKFVLIIRDFNYLAALEKGDFIKAREILSELEKLFSFFQEERKKNSKLLLVLTSSSPVLLEFPAQGKEWFDLETKGTGILFKRTTLQSSALAVGPGSEKFCGPFDQSEMLYRLYTQPKNRFNFSVPWSQ